MNKTPVVKEKIRDRLEAYQSVYDSDPLYDDVSYLLDRTERWTPSDTE